ncbi:MAG: TIGR02646 family protein [Burkholderiaceae bacterium]|nr:TIGR02646 family protein [Burkholderiaceae bacterium]
MQYLRRDPAAPTCLAKYQHGKDKWSMQSPTPPERQEIWTKLFAMQGKRCAYCEADLTDTEKEIEHFRQRDRYPKGTFDWTNLFGSCKRKNTCGGHKDSCGGYVHSDLIKPDTEDPEHFLLFTAMGTVHVRRNLSDQDQRRAKETIRILNLNGPSKALRKAQLQQYKKKANEFADLAASNDPSIMFLLEDEIRNELSATAELPYATAIRHVLTNQS